MNSNYKLSKALVHHDLPSNQQLMDAIFVVELIVALCKRNEHLMPYPVAYQPIIAGGGPRDLILDRRVKDFDIFWPVEKPYLVDAVADVARALANAGITYKRHRGFDRHYKLNIYLRREMLGVLSPDNYPTPIDIVFFDADFGKTPHEIVSTFDTSICQCWLDTNEQAFGEVRGTPDFWKSLARREIWTYPNIQTRPSYLSRLAKEFPDFHFWIDDEDLKEAFETYRNSMNYDDVPW